MLQNIHELSFTGITEDELVALEILDNENRELIEFKNDLSNKTKYLVTYKAIFTKKYVEALKINIPILSIESFFEVNKTQTPVKSINKSINNYSFGETQKCSNIKRISKFEHIVFSTSGISNPIYANYFILQGAKFDPSCNLFLDFLICEGSTSEKYIFCKNNNIPIIRTEDVFKNNFEIFLKEQTHIAHETQGGGIFENKTFYIDENLSPKLFNTLKRMILTHEGMRFSTMSNNVDYIISFSNNVDAYAEWDNVLHYQFIFDCVKSNVLLHENAYIIHRKHDLVIFNNCVICIDKPSLMENMEDKENITNEYAESYFVELENKIKALGGILQDSIDMRTTHLITQTNKEDKQYHCATPNFIDDCMMYLKHFNEDKYKPRKSIFRKRKIYKVQFTGLEEAEKNKIIDILNKHSIPYVNSDKFCKCTHLIMQNFSTTEKLFGALVSGAWIIRPEYFMDERINNMTIMNNPEILENYEWVPENINNINNNNITNNKIISAIKKWRIKIQAGGHKPFYRWNVKLYAPSKKYELYAGMIINGGGRMTENENYTHVFYDKAYKGEIKESTKISVSNIFEYLAK